VIAEEYPKECSNLVFSIILGATIKSKHPVPISIAKHLNSLGVEPSQLKDVLPMPRHGILAVSDGAAIRAGNPY